MMILLHYMMILHYVVVLKIDKHRDRNALKPRSNIHDVDEANIGGFKNGLCYKKI